MIRRVRSAVFWTRRRTVTAAVVAVALASVPRQAERSLDPPILRDLHRLHAEQEAASSNLATSIEVREYAMRLDEGRASLERARPGTGERPMFVTRVRYVGWKECFRIEDLPLDDGRSGMASPGDAGYVKGWNGEYWWEWYPVSRTLRVHSRPRWSGALDTLSLFNGRRDASFLGQQPLSDLIAGAHLVSHLRVGHSDLVTMSASNLNTDVFTLEAELAPAYRLRAAEYQALHPSQDRKVVDAQAIRFSIRYEVDEWTSKGIDPLVAWRIARDHSKQLTGFVEIRRVSAGDPRDVPPVSEDAFQPPLEDGVQVFDERLRLRYVIGSRTVFIDGQPFGTAEPIRGLITEELSKLLRKGDGR